MGIETELGMVIPVHPQQEADLRKQAEKPKRKYARKAKTSVPVSKPTEFAGLTPLDCCNACTENKCVISGINVCAHPFKGGLQSSQLSQPETVKRFNRAKNVLAGQKLKVD